MLNTYNECLTHFNIVTYLQCKKVNIQASGQYYTENDNDNDN